MTIYQYMPVFLYHTYPPLMKLKKSSGGKFRSTDLQVMSLPRYHCATPLCFLLLFFSFFSLPAVDFLKKTPSPGIEPGAQTWEACMLPTTPQWISVLLLFTSPWLDPVCVCVWDSFSLLTFLYGAILFLSFFERFHGVVGYHITFT